MKKLFYLRLASVGSIPHHNRISKTKLAANPTRRVRMGIISPPRPSLELPNFKKLTSPPKGGRSKAPSPFFYMLQALRSWGGVTDNIPTRFLPFLYGNGMRAVHLHKDISPPYSEVFRGLCRANR